MNRTSRLAFVFTLFLITSPVWIVALVVCLSLTLPGCSKSQNALTPAPSPGKPVTLASMGQAFRTAGASSMLEIYSDAGYHTVDLNWLTNTAFVRWELFRKQMTGIKDNAVDCDDHARGFAFLVQQLDPRCAIGEMFYFKDPAAVGHAIDFAIVDQDGQPTLVFCDPIQRPVRLVQLSRQELFSIWARKL